MNDRISASGSNNLRAAFDVFVADIFHRKALFDLNSLPVRRFGEFETEAPVGHHEKHLYFVTFHVRPNAYTAKDGFSNYNAKPIFSAFKSWYLSICRKLLGPRFHKKPNLQPFVMAFLDVEGSRYGKAAKAFEIPHIHALMLLHPKVVGDFLTLIPAMTLTCADDPRIGKIEIRPFKDDGRGLAPIMTYAAKYSRATFSDSRHETLWEIYPDLKTERLAFYREVQKPDRRVSTPDALRDRRTDETKRKFCFIRSG
jgi:hypothetical protein